MFFTIESSKVEFYIDLSNFLFFAKLVSPKAIQRYCDTYNKYNWEQVGYTFLNIPPCSHGLSFFHMASLLHPEIIVATWRITFVCHPVEQDPAATTMRTTTATYHFHVPSSHRNIGSEQITAGHALTRNIPGADHSRVTARIRRRQKPHAWSAHPPQNALYLHIRHWKPTLWRDQFLSEAGFRLSAPIRIASRMRNGNAWTYRRCFFPPFVGVWFRESYQDSIYDFAVFSEVFSKEREVRVLSTNQGKLSLTNYKTKQAQSEVNQT